MKGHTVQVDARRNRYINPLVVLTMVLALLPFLGNAPAGAANHVWINELHYDNTGTDTGEEIEVAGAAGTDLAGWTITLYNGNGGAAYNTLSLNGVIPDQQGGFGTVTTGPLASNAIQNGSPDGLALVDNGGNVVQFLSYEGSFDAVGGPADGMTSTDIGVFEPSDTAVGDSLQLGGTGGQATDFTWQAAQPSTFGTVNVGQTFAGGTSPLIVDCGPGIVTDEGVAASATITASDADDTIVDVSLLSDNVSPAGSLTAGTLTLPGGVGAQASLTIDLSDQADIGTYTAQIAAANESGETATCTLAIEVESTAVTITPIYEIQGTGNASPFDGMMVTTDGVVVGDFQGDDGLRGFFMQTADADADADPATSNGIFVFDGSFGVDVAVGDFLEIAGTVDEFFGLTEITNVTAIENMGALADKTVAATPLALPVASLDDWEQYEGMLVEFDQTLYATDNFNWHRNGEVLLSSGGVLEIPTNVTTPGSAALALQDLNARNQIQLDDGSNVRSPALDPPFIQPDGTLRRGDTTDGLTGVLGFSFGAYEVHPTEAVSFERVNDRLAPPDVGGTLQVASFNVLNYYTTIDESGAECFPSMTRSDCRGADSVSEFERQRAKIVDAIADLDADVVGLMEIENNGDVATADVVAGLNDLVGAGTYDYVAAGITGTDTIKVALIYQPAAVTPVGTPAVLDDPAFLDPANTGEDRNRAALAQTFTENATGETLTVVVNHLKSKSGSELDDFPDGICVDADPANDVPDCDQGDGQGYFNHTRTLAAMMLGDWLAGDPTGSGDPDVLIIGDLNAYAQEDPIVSLESRGYNDLVQIYEGVGAYTFTFFGASGYLDHGLATPDLTDDVTGTDVWHINADEPRGLDYNEENNQPVLYNPDEWRSSDHDPVVIGLDMANPRGLKEKARDDLAGLLPTGSQGNDNRIGKAIAAIEASLSSDLWADDTHLTKQGHKVFAQEKKAVQELLEVSGADAGAAQAAIALLLDADARIAQAAIDIAVATGGDPDRIAAAQSAFDAAAAAGPAQAVDRYRQAWRLAVQAVGEARFATFNASLNRFNAGDLARELSAPGSAQAATVAEIIQRTRPEVLLVNEFDFDPAGTSALLFQRNYLGVSQNGADPIHYPFRYAAESNTGIFSGFDLDNSGAAGDFVPGDSFGFGFFPGQFGMQVYSMHPIDEDDIRTFQKFLWKDMPGALLPAEPDGTPWYSDDELEVFRLSSKSHWDVPVLVGDQTVNFLVSHPTPPVFDGPEDRNGTRNHDEIRFWADYVSPEASGYVYDDAGNRGGLGPGARFVIAGDQNADPFDGDSIPGAAQQLLDHQKVNTAITPASPGGTEQAALQGGANASHLGDPAFDTADFSDGAPGNLRVDYVLPSKNLQLMDAAVFWPLSTDPLFPLVGTFPFPSSDHRLVWIDVATQ